MDEESGGELWLKDMICEFSSKIYQLSEILYLPQVLHEFLRKVFSDFRTKQMPENTYNRLTHRTSTESFALTKAGVFLIIYLSHLKPCNPIFILMEATQAQQTFMAPRSKLRTLPPVPTQQRLQIFQFKVRAEIAFGQKQNVFIFVSIVIKM